MGAGAGVLPGFRASGCPANFPFRSRSHDPALRENICYEHEWQAANGAGPCGSWCTMDATVGSGCGDNAGRLCDSGSSHQADELTSAAALNDHLARANTEFGKCNQRVQAVATATASFEQDIKYTGYVVGVIKDINVNIGDILQVLTDVG